jgi:DNA-binding NarL/FixJ family response regulator
LPASSFELFDVALVDLRMPDADGLVVLERLVAREPRPRRRCSSSPRSRRWTPRSRRSGTVPATISARCRLDEIKRAVRRTLEVQLVARDNQRYRRELRERSSSAIRRLARSPLLLPEDLPPDVRAQTARARAAGEANDARRAQALIRSARAR